MDRWFPVETDRLLLRDYRAADRPDVHEYASDPLVSRFDSWGPNDEEQTRRHFERHLAEQQSWPRTDVTLLAELQSEEKVIGSVRLWVTDPANRTAEIGYTFNRRYWGNGFASEAAAALMARAFEDLRMHRVIARCDTRNIGSWRVMEKAGMRREACFHKDVMQKGAWRDSYLYAILADEWLSRSLASREAEVRDQHYGRRNADAGTDAGREA